MDWNVSLLKMPSKQIGKLSMCLIVILQNTVVWLVNYLVKNQLVRQAMEQPAV